MKAPVYTKQGNKKGEVVLNPEIFAARINKRLLELIRNAYSANLRHGTADTKTHKEIRGGGKKPWKQKGTGRARQGSIRSAQWRGGGTVFGPQPRSYYVAMPRTMRRQALISALSFRGEQKNVMVLEDTQLESAKTKEWAEIMKALPLDGKRAICVVKTIEENLFRASRNLENWIEVRRASDVNAYDILQREKIILEQDAIAVIENRLMDGGAIESVKEGASSTAEKAPKKKVVRKTVASKATRAAAKRKTSTDKKAAKGKKKS
jgi:large subunit ribosomal protein L4